ncbi:MAG: hypothetical protein J0652_01220 [Desulfobulbaceae bacterium]|nr:hypothetical protein [Desulfobulbaceae bacterium]
MKKRKGVLLVLMALSLGMLSAAPAGASLAEGEYRWIWSGTGNTKISDFNILNTDADDFFNFILGEQSVKMIWQEHSDQAMHQPDLGYDIPPLKYGFSFTDGANTYYTYSVEEVAPSSYLLKNSNTGMIIAYQLTSQDGNVSVSHHTPIPGAVILLGSGLMGLLGISRFKKQA